MYSCTADQPTDPPIGELDLRLLRQINTGSWERVPGSECYWVNGENALGDACLLVLVTTLTISNYIT